MSNEELKVHLRRIVCEVIQVNSNLQYTTVVVHVKKKMVEYELPPLTHKQESIIGEIVWDLITERVLTLGNKTSEQRWPFLRVTEYGRNILQSSGPHYYDPEQYLASTQVLVPDLDEVIAQYLLESLKCFRAGLLFSSAVMVGAAAERSLLMLLEVIAMYETTTKKKQEMLGLLKRPNLPKIFSCIKKAIDDVISTDKMPYSVHEGVTEHLISVYEMIRVRRNEAVHPAIATVSREKMVLVLHSFPVALQVLYKAKDWFLKNANDAG